jgi:hypothetical protein
MYFALNVSVFANGKQWVLPAMITDDGEQCV